MAFESFNAGLLKLDTDLLKNLDQNDTVSNAVKEFQTIQANKQALQNQVQQQQIQQIALSKAIKDQQDEQAYSTAYDSLRPEIAQDPTLLESPARLYQSLGKHLSSVNPRLAFQSNLEYQDLVAKAKARETDFIKSVAGTAGAGEAWSNFVKTDPVLKDIYKDSLAPNLAKTGTTENDLVPVTGEVNGVNIRIGFDKQNVPKSIFYQGRNIDPNSAEGINLLSKAKLKSTEQDINNRIVVAGNQRNQNLVNTSVRTVYKNLTNDFEGTEIYKKYAPQILTLNKFDALLAQAKGEYEQQKKAGIKNPVATQQLQNQLVRLSGDVGNIAIWEQQNILPRGFTDRVTNAISRFKGGVLSDKTLGEMESLVNSYKEAYAKTIDTFGNDFIDSKVNTILAIDDNTDEEAVREKVKKIIYGYYGGGGQAQNIRSQSQQQSSTNIPRFNTMAESGKLPKGSKFYIKQPDGTYNLYQR